MRLASQEAEDAEKADRDQLRRIDRRSTRTPFDEDEGDKPKPAEVRAWLLTIPERERSDRAQSLIRRGDKLVLRAVLAAPTWMTGIPQEELDALRDDVIQASDPERYRKIQAAKKGIVAAERALAGVQKFLRQDTTPNGRREREAAARPGLRRVG